MSKPDSSLPSVPSSLRASPRQARSRRKVRLLLQAAERLILEQGLASVSIPRVAVAAGVTRPTAYRYFADTDAVFDALAARYLRLARRRIAAGWGRTRDWRAGLQGMIAATDDFYRELPVARMVLLRRPLTPQVDRDHLDANLRLADAARRLLAVRARVTIAMNGEADPHLVVVEIVNTIFALSERHHGYITKAFRAEAQRAAEAYIQTRIVTT